MPTARTVGVQLSPYSTKFEQGPARRRRALNLRFRHTGYQMSGPFKPIELREIGQQLTLARTCRKMRPIRYGAYRNMPIAA